MTKLKHLRIGDLVLLSDDKIAKRIYRVLRYYCHGVNPILSVVDVSTGFERNIARDRLDSLIRESDLPLSIENEPAETEPIIIGDTYCYYREVETKRSRCNYRIDFQSGAVPFTAEVDFKGLPDYLEALITAVALDFIFKQNPRGQQIVSASQPDLMKILITVDGRPLTHQFTWNQVVGGLQLCYSLGY